MERTDSGRRDPADIGWSDVGNWDAVWRLSARDAGGNSIWGEGVAMDSHNVHVRSTGLLTAVVGVRDVIVVTTPGRGAGAGARPGRQGQAAGRKAHKTSKRREATEHKRMYRPWGYYQSVDEGPAIKSSASSSRPATGFRCNGISIAPSIGSSSRHRRGDARRETQIVHENESIFLPIGVVHRLANPGKINLELIEVQTGSYLGEDDIVRIEDVYNRG